MQGEDIAALSIGIGWRGLKGEMERFKDNLEFTKLKTNQEGVDPDAVYSCVPYEKGFQFLWRIERQVCMLTVFSFSVFMLFVNNFSTSLCVFFPEMLRLEDHPLMNLPRNIFPPSSSNQ